LRVRRTRYDLSGQWGGALRLSVRSTCPLGGCPAVINRLSDLNARRKLRDQLTQELITSVAVDPPVDRDKRSCPVAVIVRTFAVDAIASIPRELGAQRSPPGFAPGRADRQASSSVWANRRLPAPNCRIVNLFAHGAVYCPRQCFVRPGRQFFFRPAPRAGGDRVACGLPRVRADSGRSGVVGRWSWLAGEP